MLEKVTIERVICDGCMGRSIDKDRIKNSSWVKVKISGKDLCGACAMEVKWKNSPGYKAKTTFIDQLEASDIRFRVRGNYITIGDIEVEFYLTGFDLNSGLLEYQSELEQLSKVTSILMEAVKYYEN